MRARRGINVSKLARQICKRGQIAPLGAYVTVYHDLENDQIGVKMHWPHLMEPVHVIQHFNRENLPDSLLASFPIREVLCHDSAFDIIELTMVALNAELRKTPWYLLSLADTAVAEMLVREGGQGISNVKVFQTVSICFTLYIPRLMYSSLTHPIPLGKIFSHSELVKMLAVARH